MNDIELIFERVQARQRARQRESLAVIATLPCATCTLGSESARGCQFFDRPGCKHVEELDRDRKRQQVERNRADNLRRAGMDSATVADPNVQLVVTGRLQPRKAIVAVRQALETPQLRFLVLGGPHRSGKTLALFEACATRSSSTYIRAQQLSRIDQPHDHWKATEILCINELGREHLGNGFASGNLDEIMAEREYGSRKLTIFATNLPLRAADTMQSLASRYGDLFASRIAAPIGAYVLCADAGPGNEAGAPR